MSSTLSAAHAALTDLHARFALACAGNRIDTVRSELFLPGAQINLQDVAMTVHLFHSPHLIVSPDAQSACVTWESYSYWKDGSTSSMCTTRFTAAAQLCQDGRWRYGDAEWILIQRFRPLSFAPEQDTQAVLCPVWEGGDLPGPHDCQVLRNLAGTLAAGNWRGCADFFTADAEADLEGLTQGSIPVIDWLQSVQDYERYNGGRYRCLMLLGPGALRLDSPNTASGAWTVQTFEVGGTSDAQCLSRRFCLLTLTFERGQDTWLISALRLTALQALPVILGSGTRYERMSSPESNWLYTVYHPDTPCEEDAHDVENIFSLWPVSVHRGELMNFFYAYLCQPDTVLSIRSQGPQTPAKVGTDEITGKLSGMDGMFRLGQITYHCATTPVIEELQPGLIRASWIDHSLTNQGPRADGSAGYMVFVTRYDHVFRRIDGRWYLTSFGWEPCLGIPDESFVSLPSPGSWTTDHPEERYPLPLGLDAIAQSEDDL